MKGTKIQWLKRAAILLLVITVITLILIASGIFDPAPLGKSLGREDLAEMTVDPHSRHIIWLNNTLPAPPFSARLSGAFKDGEIDSAYGLVFGDEAGYFTVAVAPTGYLAIWETTINDSYQLNWQPWPHVNQDNEMNEIWVDVEKNRARVRINRELLWEDDIELRGQNIGVLGESFGDEVVIDFQTLELFSDSNN